MEKNEIETKAKNNKTQKNQNQTVNKTKKASKYKGNLDYVININQYFTDDTHPFEKINWVKRDAFIPGIDKPTFEQKDIEVPDFWSQNALNIVAQKYFAYNPQDPHREKSVKTMINRVVKKISENGYKNKYFANKEQQKIFEYELSYILVNQIGTFNSPVWFNIGVQNVSQVCSACFILSVDDNLDSILNWYKEEGKIFQNGSGAGVNLSRLRSSGETLSKGGNSSGPVTFMRAADSNAGTITSGGRTRRAAKLVRLDIDHPDIKDFIWCKAKEEDKARALLAAGFDMSLNTEEGARNWASIQYQNANNSVGVSDAFMEAVINDEIWELKTVKTGEVVERISAKALFMEIAHAAWQCADPGLQFDDQINKWHTCSNHSPITSSNPCSEYFHVDNSSCNLASVNLRKFDDNGNFDIDSFMQAASIIFLAQEILISFADYPTEEIGHNTRAMRQIGLGYSNLGAYLMSQGLAYDSDEARDIAASITSLLTSSGYRMSVEIARRVGSFDEYENNAEPMNKVLQMHQKASKKVSSKHQPQISKAAKGLWNEIVELTPKYGIRNAQATVAMPGGTTSFQMDCDTTGIEPDFSLNKYKTLVGGGSMTIVNNTVKAALEHLDYNESEIESILEYIKEHNSVVGAPYLQQEDYSVFATAVGESNIITPMGHIKMMEWCQPFFSGAISKCITGDSLLFTKEGILRIEDLYSDEEPDNFSNLNIEVASKDRTQFTDAFYYGGEKPTFKIGLRNGFEIKGTSNHKILTSSRNGLEWKQLGEMTLKDYGTIKLGDDIWSENNFEFNDFIYSPIYGSQRKISIPKVMNEDLAYFLGAYIAEGNVTYKNYTVHIHNSDPVIIDKLDKIIYKLFNIKPRITYAQDKCPVISTSSKTLVEFFDYLDIKTGSSNKYIPKSILNSKKEIILAFLEGLMLDAYLYEPTNKWGLSLNAPRLLKEVQHILSNLGIFTGHVQKFDKTYQKYFGEIYTFGYDTQKLIENINFYEPHKKERSKQILNKDLSQSNNTASVIPNLDKTVLINNIRQSDIILKKEQNNIIKLISDQRTVNISRNTVKKLYSLDKAVLPEWCTYIIENNIHLLPVKSIDNIGLHKVYDISVPVNNAFVANSIINHNTCNLPESSTIEDIYHLYLESWKRGLKSIALYRDGSKSIQPLSSSGKKEKEAVEIATSLLGDNLLRGERRRIPDNRQVIGRRFKIGQISGYIHVGLFEDGTPGDLFVTVSQAGSALRGMIDSWAMTVSMALQYGCPLEELINKLAFSSFEPAGFTNDESIKSAKSIVDYVARWMALTFLELDEFSKSELGIISNGDEHNPNIEELAPSVALANLEPKQITDGVVKKEAGLKLIKEAKNCGQCGSMMQRTGSCWTCPSCGNNTGCG